MKGLLQMVKLGLMSSLTVDGVVYTKESPEVAASGRKYKKCCLNLQLQLQPA
jgi:hypothetical protein